MTLHLRRFSQLAPRSWRCVVVLLLTSWLLQVLIGALPWSGEQPLTMHLLPAAWVAFVAIYWFGPGVGVLVTLALGVAGIVAGDPASSLSAHQSLALVPFALISALALARWPVVRWTAPLAWLLAQASVTVFWWVTGEAEAGRSLSEAIVAAWSVELAGVGTLLGLNFALVTLLPKDMDWDAT